jgi:predicted nucleotidyltransferase
MKIAVPKEEIVQFCKHNHIRRLAFFGSVLREDFKDTSDIDILVEFEKGFVPGFLGLASLECQLSSLLGGRKVDLRTPLDEPLFSR